MAKNNETDIFPVTKSKKFLTGAYIKEDETENTLTVTQQRIFHYLVGSIDPLQDIDTPVCGNVYDFCKKFNLSYNGRIYKDFQIALNALASKKIWVTEEVDGVVRDKLCGYISNAVTYPNSGKFEIWIDRFIGDFVMNLSLEDKVSYDVSWLGECHSRYTSSCYEALIGELRKNNITEGIVSFEMNAFKRLVAATSIRYISDLLRFAVHPAIDEINTYGPFIVTSSHEKTKINNKSATMLYFDIRKKTGRTGIIDTDFSCKKILNISEGCNTSIDDDIDLSAEVSWLTGKNWVSLSEEEYKTLCDKYGQEDLDFAIDYLDERATVTNNSQNWKNWYGVIEAHFENGWIRKAKESQKRAQQSSANNTELPGYGPNKLVKISPEKYSQLVEEYGEEKLGNALIVLDKKILRHPDRYSNLATFLEKHLEHYSDWVEPFVRNQKEKNFPQKTDSSSRFTMPDQEILAIIQDKVMNEEVFPVAELKNRENVRRAISLITKSHNTQFEAELINMLCAQKPFTINNMSVKASEVCSAVGACTGLYKDGKVELLFVEDEAIDAYNRIADKEEVKYPNAFMRSCIWNALNENLINRANI